MISLALSVTGILLILVSVAPIRNDYLNRKKFSDGKTLKETIDSIESKAKESLSQSEMVEGGESILEKSLKEIVDLEQENSKRLDTHMINLCGGSIVIILSIINSNFFVKVVTNMNVLYPLLFSLVFFGICLISIVTSYYLVSIETNLRNNMHFVANRILRVPNYVKNVSKEMKEKNIEESEVDWKMFQAYEEKSWILSLVIRISNSVSYFLFIFSTASFLLFSITFINTFL